MKEAEKPDKKTVAKRKTAAKEVPKAEESKEVFASAALAAVKPEETTVEDTTKKPEPSPLGELGDGLAKVWNRFIATCKQAIVWLSDNPKRVVKGLVGFLVAFVAVLAFTGIGIYLLAWQNPFTNLVSMIIPYPAASVNGEYVSYHSYYIDVKNLNAQLKAVNVTGYTAAQINSQALNQNINELLVQQWAADHKLSVTTEEVNNEAALRYSSVGGKADALKQIQKASGLTEADYLAGLKQEMLINKVTVALAKDSAARNEARLQAKKVLVLVNKPGANIDQLAQIYSAEPKGLEAGDQGLYAVTALDPAFAPIVNTLKDGQVATDVVASPNGYSVVKRVKTVNGVAYVRIITIAPQTYAQWLAQSYQSATIKRFLRQAQ